MKKGRKGLEGVRRRATLKTIELAEFSAAPSTLFAYDRIKKKYNRMTLSVSLPSSMEDGHAAFAASLQPNELERSAQRATLFEQAEGGGDRSLLRGTYTSSPLGLVKCSWS